MGTSCVDAWGSIRIACQRRGSRSLLTSDTSLEIEQGVGGADRTSVNPDRGRNLAEQSERLGRIGGRICRNLTSGIMKAVVEGNLGSHDGAGFRVEFASRLVLRWGSTQLRVHVRAARDATLRSLCEGEPDDGNDCRRFNRHQGGKALAVTIVFAPWAREIMVSFLCHTPRAALPA